MPDTQSPYSKPHFCPIGEELKKAKNENMKNKSQTICVLVQNLFSTHFWGGDVIWDNQKEMIYPKNRLIYCQGLLKLHGKLAAQHTVY